MKNKYLVLLLGLIFSVFFIEPAWAQEGVEDVAENIVESSAALPGLLTALCYLLGLVFGITALLKLKDHCIDPDRVPIGPALVRAIAGGFLFAFPILHEAVQNAISGGSAAPNDYTELMDYLNATVGTVLGAMALGSTVNGVISNIGIFTDALPGIITAAGYLLGMVMVASGVIKVKEVVEQPDKTGIREPVIRFLIAGALFALPNIYDAMYVTITDGGMSTVNTFMSATYAFLMVESDYSTGTAMECTLNLADGSIGTLLCLAMYNTFLLPTLMTMVSYLLGCVFGFWGLIKIRDHVLDPSRTKISEGVMRFLAGGVFFALPYIAVILSNTVGGIIYDVFYIGTPANSGFRENLSGCGSGNAGLDVAMACTMSQLLGPVQIVLNFFGFVAGLVLIMIGTSRLIKSSQDGPRGPGGMGTIASFVIGGFLISGTAFIRSLTATFFNDITTLSYASLEYAGSMSSAETTAVYNVISAVLKFMMIVGLISVFRGLFMVRQVAEGNQQASAMSAMTHIIGGTIAINLGPLINAVQATLGITAFGVTFY